MLDLAERAAPELLGARQTTWLAQLEREHDNLAAALRWTIDAAEIELSLRLASALWRFWWLHGHLSEGMAWMDAVVSASREIAPDGEGAAPAVRLQPLLPARAGALLQESLTLLRDLGDARGIASALHNLAAVTRDAGDWQRAADLHAESLALWRELGDRWGVAASLHDLARATNRLGEAWRAAGLLSESLALFAELGVRQGTAACLEGLAGGAITADRPLDAGRLLGAAEAVREAIG